MSKWAWENGDVEIQFPQKPQPQPRLPSYYIRIDGATDYCLRYARGLLIFDDLRARLAAFPWKPDPRFSDGPRDLEERLEWIDEHALDVTLDTISELEHCMGLGYITHDEYSAITLAIAERSGSAPPPN